MKIIKNILEYAAMGVLIILLTPIALIVIVFIAFPIFIYEEISNRLRNAPKPTVPNILDSTEYDSYETAKFYVQKIKSSIPKEDISFKYEEDFESYTFRSKALEKREVKISVDDFSCDVSITDLNSYEWNTASEQTKNIDFDIWICIGALRNGVCETRSHFGRKNYWVWCDELNVWCVVQRAGSSYDSINFYEKDKAPEKVRASLV